MCMSEKLKTVLVSLEFQLLEEDTNWFLFNEEDQAPEKHEHVAEKWNSQRKTPAHFRNVLVQGAQLALYLNEDQTAFSFGGTELQRDEENSIKEKGLLL